MAVACPLSPVGPRIPQFDELEVSDLLHVKDGVGMALDDTIDHRGVLI